MSTNNKNILYCSFCGKSQHEVRKLIAEKKWRTLDGRIIPIKQMSISHIKNTINFLKGKSKFFDTDLPEAEKEMYHKLFQKEIINR